MRPGLKAALLLICGIPAVGLGIRYLLPLCFPFLLGTALALAAEPAVSFLSGRLKFPRGLAAGIGVTLTGAGICLLVVLLCALLLRELGLLANILPDVTRMASSGAGCLENWLVELADRTPESIQPLLRQNVRQMFSGSGDLVSRGFQYTLNLAGDMLSHLPDSALSLGTGVISGFMISAKLPRIRRWLRRRFPKERLRPMVATLKRLRTALAGWLLAQCKLAGVTFLLLFAGMLLLRIPYALLWAAGICLLDAFPVLGTGTVLLPWSLICFLQGDRARGAGLLGVYAVISLLRSVLEPRLVGRQLGLDPLVTLAALYAGYKLWGLPGMILAPVLAMLLTQIVMPREKESDG